MYEASGKSLSDNNSDYDEGHGQQEEENFYCDPTFEASCFSSEPNLLTQGDLNSLIRDLNLSKVMLTSNVPD